MPRTALVTGGSRGIGLAVARALCADGLRVGLIARDEDRLNAAARTLSADTPVATADVADPASARAAVDTVASGLGGLDVVIVAAGFTGGITSATPYDEAIATWDSVVGANLRGAFCTVQAAMPHLRRDGGRVIAVSSIAAYTGGRAAGGVAYAAAKAGVLGLVRGLARELTPQGCTVNAVAPGFIATDFHGDDPQAAAAPALAAIPAGRTGGPDEVAATVAFLASPAAAYISGEVVHVNGGWLFGA